MPLAIGDYQAEIGRVADVLRSLVLKAPPNLGAGGISAGSCASSASSPRSARGCGRTRALEAAFRLFRKSAGDMLDDWFESDPIKAVLGFDAVVGNLASPYTRGLRLCAAAPRASAR